jgi:large subunit ribosomal protein L30
MICIIRITGRVGLNRDVNETLDRLRLRKKYTCIVIKSNKVNLGMIEKVKNFVAYGEIQDKDFEKLIEARGKAVDGSKKVEPKSVVEGFKKGKKLQELNLKPFFRLHPARKGMNTKVHFPKGALGNHKNKINELLARML